MEFKGVFCLLVLLFVSWPSPARFKVNPRAGSRHKVSRTASGPPCKRNQKGREALSCGPQHSSGTSKLRGPPPAPAPATAPGALVPTGVAWLQPLSKCLVELMVVSARAACWRAAVWVTVTQLSRTRGWGSGCKRRKRKLMAGILCI